MLHEIFSLIQAAAQSASHSIALYNCSERWSQMETSIKSLAEGKVEQWPDRITIGTQSRLGEKLQTLHVYMPKYVTLTFRRFDSRNYRCIFRR